MTQPTVRNRSGFSGAIGKWGDQLWALILGQLARRSTEETPCSVRYNALDKKQRKQCVQIEHEIVNSLWFPAPAITFTERRSASLNAVRLFLAQRSFSGAISTIFGDFTDEFDLKAAIFPGMNNDLLDEAAEQFQG